MNELLKTQMLMSLSSVHTTNPLFNLVFFNLYERLVASFPAWYPKLKGCCRRRKDTVQVIDNNKEIKCNIVFERIVTTSNGSKSQSTANQTKMDSVINYLTNIPAIRNLLCLSQHDYLPNEFEPLQIEPDLYFQLIDLSYKEGQVEVIKFKLFCYEHEIQFLQTFVDRCNIDYERRMSNKLGTSLYFFDMMITQNQKRAHKILFLLHTFFIPNINFILLVLLKMYFLNKNTM